MTDNHRHEIEALGAFLRELSSPQGLFGSGSAAGVALALAAACAAKAAALTLKHRPDDLRLRSAHDNLLRQIDAATAGAEQDARRFAQFLHNRSSDSVQHVIAVDEKLLNIVDDVTAILESIEPYVQQSVAGDLVAARALAGAARTIQVENISELRAGKS
jgi:Formiminotransferase-cyclodeaminase